MKNVLLLFALISISTLISCSKEESSQTNENCDHLALELSLDPLCTFYPASSPTTQFAVRVIYQGSPVELDGLTFLWESTGSVGSAALLTYDDLPIMVTVTEEETGCEVVLSIDSDYWE